MKKWQEMRLEEKVESMAALTILLIRGAVMVALMVMPWKR